MTIPVFFHLAIQVQPIAVSDRKINPYRKDRELYPHCPWCGQKLKEAEDETEKENQQAE